MIFDRVRGRVREPGKSQSTLAGSQESSWTKRFATFCGGSRLQDSVYLNKLVKVDKNLTVWMRLQYQPRGKIRKKKKERERKKEESHCELLMLISPFSSQNVGSRPHPHPTQWHLLKNSLPSSELLAKFSSGCDVSTSNQAEASSAFCFSVSMVNFSIYADGPCFRSQT